MSTKELLIAIVGFVTLAVIVGAIAFLVNGTQKTQHAGTTSSFYAAQDEMHSNTGLQSARQGQALPTDQDVWYSGTDWQVAHSTSTALPQYPQDQNTPSEEDTFDIAALFKSFSDASILSQFNTATDNTTQNDSDILWGGFYNETATQAVLNVSSELEGALHAYGNEVAGAIDSFIETQGDQVAIVNAFVNDVTNTDGVIALAESYDQLAEHIAALSAPSPVQNSNTRLAGAYKNVSIYMRALTENPESDLANKLLAYNTQVEEVVVEFITIADILGAYGVVYQDSEPGAMFQFTPSF